MVDSDIDADLFGSSEEEEKVDLNPAPEYVNTPDFKKFLKDEGIKLDPEYGFS